MLTKNKDLLDRAMRAEAEVERLRSENLELRVAVLGPDGIRANQEVIIGEQAARIKELEEMIRQLGSLAFMGDMPLDQIVAHFIAWGQSNYDYTSLLEAAFLDSLAARLYYEHYPGVSDAYSWHDYPEEACHSMPKEEFRKKAREALARIKEGKG